MAKSRVKVIEGYTWSNWREYFCKTWTRGTQGEVKRIVHYPDTFTSSGDRRVKIKITIEEVTELPKVKGRKK